MKNDKFVWLEDALLTVPNWEKLNAYERTKIACRKLTRKGMVVPAWTTLRDIIGGGSGTDINRAKDDFQTEHQKRMSDLEGMESDLPPELRPFVTQLWESAISHVRKQLAAQEEELAERMAKATAEVEKANDARDTAVHHAETLTKQLEDAKELHVVLRSQVDTERAIRIETEQRLDAHMSEIKQQRDQLEAALQTNQKELHAALERIDGVQKHTLMQIEEARASAKQSIQEAHQRNERAMSSVTTENARLTKLVHETTSRRTELEKKLDQLMTELKDRELTIARLNAASADGEAKPTARGTLLKQRRTIQRRKSSK